MLHLHAEGVIHRDLAARNVLLTVQNEAIISDYGISRVLQSFTKATAYSLGPIKWMAPEALQNDEYSKKSDVFLFLFSMFLHPNIECVRNS